MARPTVAHYFKDTEELQNRIMEYAVANKALRVIAQGMASSHPIALAAPKELKEEAANYIANR